MEGQEAPVTGQGEQGTPAPEAPNYAGFSDPAQLAQEYTTLKSQHEQLNGQVKNLEQLKGRQGSELGQLRQSHARLQGMIEAMQQQRPTSQGPTVEDIGMQLQAGQITEAQAFKAVADIATQQSLTLAEQKFQKALSAESGKFREELSRRDYVSQFMAENPGYKEAYAGGKLSQWIDQGMSGEEAWANFQLTQTRAELDALKKQAETSKKQAEQDGIKKGAQLEAGKTAAGKVLGQHQASFTQGAQGPQSREQRKQAALATLQKMRSGQ